MILLLPFVLIAFFIGLWLLSVMFRWMKKSMPGFDEPVRIPKYLGWSLLLAAVALNIFAYDGGFGIGLGIFGACVIAAIVLLFPSEKQTSEVWFLGVVGVVACLLFGFRANEFVQIVNVVAAVLCVGGLALLRSVETPQWNGLWFLKMKFGFLARVLNHPFALGSALRPSRTTGGSTLMTTLKTVALTFIVLIFFSWILSSADPVFDNLIREVREQAMGRVIVSGILVTFLLAFLTVTVPRQWQEKAPQLKALGFLEMFVPAMSLALLFGLFLGIQAKYLFGGHEVFQSLDITYADYVRKGFIELLIAAFFGSILSYALILKQHALEDAGKILKLKWVNGVLIVELMLLLASAAKRDWMYVETYGLTRVRVIGAIFLLWLLVIIALILALNFLRTMTERRLLIGGAMTSAFVVLILNAVNVDHVIALSSPPRGERPDVVYMSRLSEDAVEGWLAALSESASRYASLREKTTFTDEEKTQLADAKIALATLENRFMRISEPRPWQEWNWSRMHANLRIDGNNPASPLQTVRCLRGGIRKLQVLTKTDLSNQEYSRINDYYSPFIFDDLSYDWEHLDSIIIPPSMNIALPTCDNGPVMN